MVTMIRSTESGPSRESLRGLRAAKQAARPEDVRQWPCIHLEDGMKESRGGSSMHWRASVFVGLETLEVARPIQTTRTNSIDVVPLAGEWRGVQRVDVEAVKGREAVQSSR